MRPATPYLTAESLRVVPAPMMAPVIVWVVETGMPAHVAPNRVIAPAVSAEKPPTGWSFVILAPIVWTMRQPPESVPRAMAACAVSTTHSGVAWLFRGLLIAPEICRKGVWVMSLRSCWP